MECAYQIVIQGIIVEKILCWIEGLRLLRQMMQERSQSCPKILVPGVSLMNGVSNQPGTPFLIVYIRQYIFEF